MRFIGVFLSLLLAAPCFATTIAWDGKSMACDSQRSGGHMKVFVNNKIVRSEKRHATMGAGGDVNITRGIKKYFVETDKPLSEYPLPEKVEPGSFGMIVVYDDGRAELYDGSLVPDVLDPPFAFGTGGEYAMAAMRLGLSAEKAIALAVDMDLYTGGTVHVFKAPLTKK